MQALLATRHAERMWAVDISPHALALARLTQRLNGVADRITWLEASWLEALRGQRFDLVVANPPYVVSPDDAFVFRDGQDGGDEVSRHVVRESASALTEGGFAVVMCNWIHAAHDWEAPLRGWVDGLGCDVLIRRVFSRDPLTYAMSWNSSQVKLSPQEFGSAVTRWVAHYVRTGVERIAAGFVVLRRRSASPNWVQAFDGGSMPLGRSGDHVQRIFTAGDALAPPAGAAQLARLLSRSWSLIDGHRLEQHAVYAEGAYAGKARMRQSPTAASMRRSIQGACRCCSAATASVRSVRCSRRQRCPTAWNDTTSTACASTRSGN